MVDFISIFFSILWGYISGIALFIFYTLLVFILVSMPLKFIAKKLFKQTNNEEPSKALSFIFIVLMLLPGVTGAFLYMNRANIVKPFTAKLFTYPVTEIIITFPQKIDDKQSKKLQQFFLKYFNQYQKKQFEGGSTYVRGNQLIENEDGVIPHHWKLNDDKLHIFLSDSLSQEKMADLQRIFNIWFPKTIPQKKLADVVSLTMNPENESVLFPLLFKKKDTSKLPIKDQIRLYSNNQLMSIYNLTDSLLDSNNKEEKPPYFFHERYMVSEKNNSNVIINPYSLTFRMSGFDIFKIAGAHAPVEIRCDAVFDIKQGIWEKELLKSATTISTLAKQMSFNQALGERSNKAKAFKHFYKIRFKALLSNGEEYDAYIYTYPINLSNHGRASDSQKLTTTYKYAQKLILTLEAYDTIYQDNKERCLKLVKNNKSLYSFYINNILPNDITMKIKSVNITTNKKFSPFYDGVNSF